MKAIKFGGTSMSTAESITKVRDIILSDAERRYIVVSAPGKAVGVGKVTDALIKTSNAEPMRRAAEFSAVAMRFEELCTSLLGDAEYLKSDIDKIRDSLSTASRDYIVSRGEYLSAKLLAKILNYDFVDAADIIRFNRRSYNDEYTESVCRLELSKHSCAVIPGFYGSNENGEIVTFSRGGSDISGAIIARAIGASVYENFTDVDGFMTCDPRIVPHASVIDVITYNELRELSYMGANVLHPDSIFPVRRAGIPIHIKNTFNPTAGGTLIVPTEQYLQGKYARATTRPITGIAGLRNMYSLHVDKSMMNNEIGFARKLLSCFERFGISIEHVPTGIDTMTVVFSGVEQNVVNALMKAVQDECKPDHMHLSTDLSLIAIVGHGMASRPGTATRAFMRLSTANINIRMIDQGSSEINIILGVSDEDFERALIALNGEFEV